MAHITVLRQRRELALLVVTREAGRVSQWSRLERSFLQPERITDILWRLSNELIIRFALRLISLMAIGAICIGMFVVRKKYAKLGDKVDAFSRGKKRFAKTRERVTRRVDWRRFHMTVGTDPWNRPLTREELLSMTIQAGCMFGKLGHVRKRGIAFADFLPVFGGKLVTGVTPDFLFVDVCGVRKARVVNRSWALRASLSVSRYDGPGKSDYHKCR